MAGKKRPAPKRISDTPTPSGRGRPAGTAGTAGNGTGGATRRPPSQTGDTTAVRRSAPSRRAVTQVTGGSGGYGGRQSPSTGAQGNKYGPRTSGRTHQSSRRISPAQWGYAAGSAVLVAVLVIVLLAVTNQPVNNSSGDVPVAAATIHSVTNLSPAVLDNAGIDGQPASSTPANDAVAVMKTAHAGANGLPPVDGKPVVFYFGALWCPYCATERWSIVVALSRFGTFTGLRGAVSSSTDVYPSTQTWSFASATYTSPYIVFNPVEYENEQKGQLESLTSAESAILAAWDPAGSFPFLTIGQKYTAGLPDWLSPQLLQQLSRDQILETLSEPSNQLGLAIDANANYLSAAICAVDGQQPAAVCTAKGVSEASAQLAKMPAAVPISS
jgi:thiol-disulfide isomerase/thioredoxin